MLGVAVLNEVRPFFFFSFYSGKLSFGGIWHEFLLTRDTSEWIHLNAHIQVFAPFSIKDSAAFDLRFEQTFHDLSIRLPRLLAFPWPSRNKSFFLVGILCRNCEFFCFDHQQCRVLDIIFILRKPDGFFLREPRDQRLKVAFHSAHFQGYILRRTWQDAPMVLHPQCRLSLVYSSLDFS